MNPRPRSPTRTRIRILATTAAPVLRTAGGTTITIMKMEMITTARQCAMAMAAVSCTSSRATTRT